MSGGQRLQHCSHGARETNALWLRVFPGWYTNTHWPGADRQYGCWIAHWWGEGGYIDIDVCTVYMYIYTDTISVL